jgi:hypothetical protein
MENLASREKGEHGILTERKGSREREKCNKKLRSGGRFYYPLFISANPTLP